MSRDPASSDPSPEESSVLELSVIFAIALAAGLLRAWHLWDYAFEDSYITYVYAENLGAGRGFVFNQGERVLGTTTPLLTLLLAAASALGVDVAWAGKVLFFSCHIALAPLGFLVLRELGARAGAVLFGLWIALDPLRMGDFVGMETPLVALLGLGAFLAWLCERTALAGLLGALAALARPDHALLLVLMALGELLRKRSFPWRFVVPPLLLGGSWLVFSALYFGSLYPNTLGAKAGEVGFLEYLAPAGLQFAQIVSNPLHAASQWPSGVAAAAGFVVVALARSARQSSFARRLALRCWAPFHCSSCWPTPRSARPPTSAGIYSPLFSGPSASCSWV